MLELFYEEKVKGIIIQARARWDEHGEESTKYLLNPEKRNHIKKKCEKCHALKNKQSLHLLKRKEKIAPFCKTGNRFLL